MKIVNYLFVVMLVISLARGQLNCNNQPNCLMCELRNSSRCTICSLSYQLDKNGAGTCVKECGPKYFLNDKGQCQLCQDLYKNCATCDKTSCTICQLGYKLDDKKICQIFDLTMDNILNEKNTLCSQNLAAWVPTSLINLAEGVCKQCPVGCKECKFVGGQMQCSSCISDKYKLDNFACLAQANCTAGQFFDTTTCQNCPSNCLECSQLKVLSVSQIVCNKCKDNFTQSLSDPSKCNQICTKSQYFNPNTASCNECNAGIQNCAACIPIPELILNILQQDISKALKCVECASGFFYNLQSGQCQKTELKCADNQVPFYANNSCLDCNGCKTCKLMNQLEPFSFQCDTCLDGYTKENITQKCLRQAATLKQCNPLQEFMNPLTQTCQKWPDSFVKCIEKTIKEGSIPVCLKCLENYILDNSQQCIEKQTCQSSQFLLNEGSNYRCAECSLFVKGCRQCVQAFGLSAKCISCESGNPQPDGSCLASTACSENQYDALSVISSATKDASPTTQNALKRCINCPTSCRKCSLITKDSILPSCTECAEGFQLTVDSNNQNNQICSLVCQLGQFLDKATNSCIKCPDSNCKLCLASGKCSKCNVGFSIDSKTGLCITDNTSSSTNTGTTTNNQQCPTGSVKNSAGICQCAVGSVLQQVAGAAAASSATTPQSSISPALALDKVQICQPETKLQCKVGEYMNSATNKCQVCLVKDNKEQLMEGICTKCLSSDKCIECARGYYIDVNSNSCLSCQSNCALCDNAQICQKCQAPYVNWKGSCSLICPSGTLPLVESLYRLNTQLFDNSDKNTLYNKQFTVQEQPSAMAVSSPTQAQPTTSTCNPIAINIDGKTVCQDQKSQLPFTYSEELKKYQFNGQDITLQCQPCKEKCTACPDGFILRDDQQCTTDCQFPFKIFEQDGKKTCQQVDNTKQLVQIQHISRLPQRFGLYNIQNLQDDLIMTVKYDDSVAIQSFQWRLAAIYNGAGVTEQSVQEVTETLPSDVEVDTISLFNKDVIFNERKLFADDSNLAEKIIYKINVTLTTATGSVLYDEYKFIVLPFRREMDFKDLDISSEDWGTTLDQGIATQDQFCAFYNFRGSKIVGEDKSWKFSVLIFPDGLPTSARWQKIYDSVKLQDNYCFTTPYINLDEVKVIVRFTAALPEVSYTGLKVIRLLKPSNYDLSSSQAFKKIQQATTSKDVQLDQTAQLASSLFNIQQNLMNKSATNNANSGVVQYKQICVINSTQVEQNCFGHGKCYSYNAEINRCKCDAGWEGHPQCALEAAKMSEISGQAQVLVEKAALKLQQQLGTTPTPAEAKQGVETAKQALNLGAVSRTAVDNIQSIIENSVGQLDDTESANTLLDLIDRLNDIYDTLEDQLFLNKTLLNRRLLAQADVQSIDQQKSQKQNITRKAACKAAENQFKQLGGDKAEITLQSLKQKFQIGQIKKPESSLSVQISVNVSVQLPKSVLPQNGGTYIVNLVEKASILANAKLSNVTIAGKPTDIKLYDKVLGSTDGSSQFKLKNVKNITEKIKVKVDQEDAKGTKDSQKKCYYLDEVDQKLKSDGVEYNTTSKMCESSHLTLFVVAIIPEATPTSNPTNSSNNGSTNPSVTQNQNQNNTSAYTLVIELLLLVCLLGAILI